MYRKHTSYRKVPKVVKGLFFLAMIALFAFVVGHLIMFLWNEILVETTGVKALNYWQALGLFLLSRILFGGFRFGSRSKWKEKRAKWKSKWTSMSDEERAAFKQKWRERCSSKKNTGQSES